MTKYLTASDKGNFKAIISLCADQDMTLGEFIKNSSETSQYTSLRIQNDIIDIIASKILKRLIDEINHSVCWGFSFDETPDKSRKEQISFVERFADQNYKQKEVFLCYFDAYLLTQT